jgi:hypothetical protein
MRVWQDLLRAIQVTIGNKVYTASLEKLFTRLEAQELEPDERQALEYLMRDLHGLRGQLDRAGRQPWYGWRP